MATDNLKPLSELSPGSKGIIRKMKTKGAIRRRLMDMGFVTGTTVEVEKMAPLGDPVDILVKGCHVSIRKEEAQNVWVEVTDEPEVMDQGL
jgi:ferrous iron transport protein A